METYSGVTDRFDEELKLLGTTPVSRNFPWIAAQLKPQALREDRILQEIHATGGDVRRM
ncbi:hypothetical protein [Streptomyces sp. NPDC051684]|uniref:hypothetical protein n=1 Tax=Streptomyces sp. NPDC051684 TaxID=3365670 RepID=UPI00379B495F